MLFGLAVAAKWLRCAVSASCRARFPDRALARRASGETTARRDAVGQGSAALARPARDSRAGRCSALIAVAAYFLTFLPAFFYHDDPMTLAELLPFQAKMYAQQTQVLPHAHLSVELVDMAADDPPDLVFLRARRRRDARHIDDRQPGDPVGRAGRGRGVPVGAAGAGATGDCCSRAACGSRAICRGSSSPSRSASSIITTCRRSSCAIALAAAFDRYAKGRLTYWDEGFMVMASGWRCIFSRSCPPRRCRTPRRSSIGCGSAPGLSNGPTRSVTTARNSTPR